MTAVSTHITDKTVLTSSGSVSVNNPPSTEQNNNNEKMNIDDILSVLANRNVLKIEIRPWTRQDHGKVY